MNTILVTGGTGFLGSNLCSRLISEGNRVICVDNNYTGRLHNIVGIVNHPNFRFIEHDICEPLNVNDEKIDQIYNLACPASPPAYQGNYSIKTTKTCVFGAINMLELAKKHNATILQASTSEVYGEPLVHPQIESYRGNVNLVRKVCSLIIAATKVYILKLFVFLIRTDLTWILMTDALFQILSARL